MSADKYLSIFSRQMEDIVYIYRSLTSLETIAPGVAKLKNFFGGKRKFLRKNGKKKKKRKEIPGNAISI